MRGECAASVQPGPTGIEARQVRDPSRAVVGLPLQSRILRPVLPFMTSPPARRAAARPSAPVAAEAPGGLTTTVAARLLEQIVRQDHPVGERLKEQALADALGVSRSPIRKALQFLETLGAVRSEPNRGYQLALAGDDLRALRIEDSASDEAVYMRIVEDRLADAIGQEVSEAELMERHQLSRLQVQRALNRMAREGLAERKPGRGWQFRPVLQTLESHRASYRFRMIIEPAALLEPGYRIDAPAFDRVRAQQHRLLDGGIARWTPGERFLAGAEFHETLVACAHNTFLLDALRSVNQQRRIFEYHTHTRAPQDVTRLERQCQEHLALLDLLEAGERVEAAHQLRQHLDVVSAIKAQSQSRAPQGAAPTGHGTASEEPIRIHL